MTLRIEFSCTYLDKQHLKYCLNWLSERYLSKFCNPNSIFTDRVRNFHRCLCVHRGGGYPLVLSLVLSKVLSLGMSPPPYWTWYTPPPARLDRGYHPLPGQATTRAVRPLRSRRRTFLWRIFTFLATLLSAIYLSIFIHRLYCTCNILKLSLLCKKEVKYRLLPYT